MVNVNRYRTIFFVALLVFLLDQGTKYLAQLFLGNPFEITSFLSLKLAWNTGAAFSFVTGNNTLLIWIGFIFVGGLFYFIDSFPDDAWSISALGLIIGGAFGNLLDRILLGRVTDMIAFTFFPTFNLADSALTIGILILIVCIWKEERKKYSFEC